MKSRSVRLSVILLVSLLASRHAPASRMWRWVHNTIEHSGSTVDCRQWHPEVWGDLAYRGAVSRRQHWLAGPLTAGGTFAQAYYETLLRSDEKGNLYGWLAESFKLADDKKSITFTIRKGVKFTDGSDLTADVVKWNLDQFMIRNPSGHPSRWSIRIPFGLT